MRKPPRSKENFRSGTDSPSAKVLAGLNPLDTLNNVLARYPNSALSYGPAPFVGEAWAAALLWLRGRGYYGYQQLTLYGVWVLFHSGEFLLQLGWKKVAFQHSIYNPEAYHQLIRQGFQTYYGMNAADPPLDRILYQTRYEERRRIELRRILDAELVSSFSDAIG